MGGVGEFIWGVTPSKLVGRFGGVGNHYLAT